jgi:hypothetical protein
MCSTGSPAPRGAPKRWPIGLSERHRARAKEAARHRESPMTGPLGSASSSGHPCKQFDRRPTAWPSRGRSSRFRSPRSTRSPTPRRRMNASLPDTCSARSCSDPLNAPDRFADLCVETGKDGQPAGRAALDRQIESEPAAGNQPTLIGRRRGLGAGIRDNGSRGCEYSAQ